MKLIFISNYLNQHLTSLCQSFVSSCVEFHFISTDSEYRQGYQKLVEKDYALHYDYDEQKETVVEIIKNADVVIMGSCPNELVDLRVQTGKLTFLYSERFFKKGTWRRFIPKTRKAVYNRAIKYKDCGNFFVLCSSAYLPYDLSLFGFPVNKCFKWGYFPVVKKYDDIEEIIKLKNPVSILWTARFIKWKHPEIPVKVAKKLKEDGYRFELNMIGDGVCRPRIEKMIRKYELGDYIHLLGSMSPEEVRKNMEQSEIFLFTSDRNEGWGAVLNESMNSGCAVIANRAIGAVPYLIKDEENGFIYNGNVKDMYKKVRYLLDNPEKRKGIGKCAYNTMTDLWSAEIAAGRLQNTATKIYNKDYVSEFYQNGPCSKVEIIKG